VIDKDTGIFSKEGNIYDAEIGEPPDSELDFQQPQFQPISAFAEGVYVSSASLIFMILQH